ncbi:7381_t:CDS:2 [Cetraspora pellucida]|uniref:7381_t:CDS:1 n=1 Tax=Cetraspora pellucida TaxID=1433469 RepID=A0ACA9KIJ1_9GLOM|nr:7381_t:CDS:2 [Cetraspora pellucida]
MADYFFTAATCLAILLCIAPGIFYVQTRNWGVVLMIFWVIATNTILFINSILWADDLDDKAPVYCLISTPIYVGANVGLLASISCMIYTLYTLIACPMIVTEQVKRKQTVIDFSLIIGAPIVLTGFNYLVQTNKYGIRPVLGCFPVEYVNALFFLVHGIWPVIISIIGCYYAARTSYAILKKRLEIQTLLRRTESGLNSTRFYRLVFFCITFLIFSFPASLLTLFSNIAQSDNLLEFKTAFSFNDYHHEFDKVRRFDSGITVVDYAKPLAGFFVFLFFGTGQDASAAYKRWARMAKLDRIFVFLRENYDDLRSQSTKSSNGQVPSFPDSPFRSPKHFRRQSDSFGDEKDIPKIESTTYLKPKKGLSNLLFLNGHRTLSEQAQIDMTSGINIKIDGITTNIIRDDNDSSIEESTLVYQAANVFPRGINEALEEYDNKRLDEQNETSTFGPISRTASMKSSSNVHEYNNSFKPKTVQHINIQPDYVDADNFSNNSLTIHIEDDNEFN